MGVSTHTYKKGFVKDLHTSVQNFSKLSKFQFLNRIIISVCPAKTFNTVSSRTQQSFSDNSNN